jgi:hypothetical protein
MAHHDNHQHFVITIVAGAFHASATADTLQGAEYAARQLRRDCFDAQPDSRSSRATVCIVGPLAGPAV